MEESSEQGLETEEECKRKKSEMPTCRLVLSPFSNVKKKTSKICPLYTEEEKRREKRIKKKRSKKEK